VLPSETSAKALGALRRTVTLADVNHHVSQQVEHLEIRLVKKAGVPRAEVEAHQVIQREFNSATFSKGWRGYASFALARAGRGSGDDDLDLVLVTHTGIVLIELKNWNGKLLESNGQKWYLDGEDRGDSPVAVVRRKVPKLVSVMTQKLGKNKTPFIRCLRAQCFTRSVQQFQCASRS